MRRVQLELILALFLTMGWLGVLMAQKTMGLDHIDCFCDGCVTQYYEVVDNDAPLYGGD